MASAAPLYGSILLGKDLSLEQLSERLEWVAQKALQHSDFTAYLTTNDGQRYYGLDRQEWIQNCREFSGSLERLSFSLGIPNSGGVRLNFRFGKSPDQALGQYIIASGHQQLNEVIRDMIQGNWDSSRESELETIRKELEEATKVEEAPAEVEESQLQEEEEMSQPQVLGASVSDAVLGEKEPIVPDQEDIEIQQTAETAEDVSEEMKVEVESPEEASDKPLEEDYFEDENAFVKHFSFNQKKLSLDLLIAVTRAVSDTYMKGEPPWAEVSTHTHKYTDLGLGELKNLLRRQNKLKVNQIRLLSQHPQTQHFFELTFDFTRALEGPKGMLRLQLADHKKHKTVETLVWDRLGLGYRRVKPSVPRSKKGLMKVSPVFQTRTFEDRSPSCLVIMPLEAYWSEAVWTFFKDFFDSLDFNTQRADGLFVPDKLETIWKDLNEADILVADLTYKHPGIFYTLGIAHTLGKSVILISQHERDVPMDFQALGYIIYDNNAHGMELLREELNRILGHNKKHKSTTA